MEQEKTNNQNEEEQMSQQETEKIAGDNFAKWARALLEKSPEVMAAFYSDDATFLPTVSPDFKKGKEGAADYFAQFLQKDPTGEIKRQTVKQFGSDAYLHQGIYVFEVGPADDRQKVEADFSYAWTKSTAGDWEVRHHHSSVLDDEGVKRERVRVLNDALSSDNGKIFIHETQDLANGVKLHSGMLKPGDDPAGDLRFTFVEEEVGGLRVRNCYHLSKRPAGH